MPRLPWIARYSLAPATTLLCCLVQLALVPEVDLAPFAFFPVAVVIASWIGGRGPGMLAVALSAATANFVFIPAHWHWSLSGPALAATALYVGASSLVALVCATFRDALLQVERSAAALSASEARVRIAQEAARIGSFEWNIQTGVNTWSPELEAMHGLPPGGFASSQPAWEQLVHPDDRAEAVRKVEEALETGLPKVGEWRVVWPDGSIHWLSGRFQAFRDSSGRLLRLTGVNIDISDRKRVEAALRQQVEIINLSLDAIFVWRLTGGIESWNRGAEVLYGFTAEEARDRITHDLLKTRLPAPRAQFQAELKRRRQWEGELVHTTKDGQQIAVWVRMLLVRNDGVERVLETTRDISERRRAEESLKESEERLSALVTASSETLYRMSPDWREMRQLHSRGLLANVETSSGNWLQTYIPLDEQARVSEAISEAIRAKGTFELEHRVLGKDGSQAWVFSRAVPLLNAQGEIVEWFGAATDITARKLAQEELKRNEKALREADRRKNEFLAMLSHELRNPLAPIRNSLYVLERAAPGGEQARRAKARHRAPGRPDGPAGRRPARRDAASPAARSSCSASRSSLRELVGRTVEDHRSLFAARGVELRGDDAASRCVGRRRSRPARAG